MLRENEANRISHIPRFRLMDLAPELRVAVYRYALTFDEPIKVVVAKKDVSLSYTAPPALTNVSIKVRKECLPIYYINNHFELYLNADRDKHGTAANGWENPIILKWLCKIGDLRHKGRKAADIHITSKMRALSVIFQARVLHRTRNMLPAEYEDMRLDVTYSAKRGLDYAVPSNFAHKWLGGILRLEQVLANTRSLNSPGMSGGQKLFSFFLRHPALMNDWKISIASDGRNLASGAMLAAECTGCPVPLSSFGMALPWDGDEEEEGDEEWEA